MCHRVGRDCGRRIRDGYRPRSGDEWILPLSLRDCFQRRSVVVGHHLLQARRFYILIRCAQYRACHQHGAAGRFLTRRRHPRQAEAAANTHRLCVVRCYNGQWRYRAGWRLAAGAVCSKTDGTSVRPRSTIVGLLFKSGTIWSWPDQGSHRIRPFRFGTFVDEVSTVPPGRSHGERRQCGGLRARWPYKDIVVLQD